MRPQLSRASGGRPRTLLRSSTQASHRFARRLRLPRAARGRGDIAGPAGTASESLPLTVRRVRPAVQASVDRKSVVYGKSVSVRVDLGGRRIITKTNDSYAKS